MRTMIRRVSRAPCTWPTPTHAAPLFPHTALFRSNPAYPPKSPRMLLATTALLALLLGVAVTLTQCKMVTDGLSTTGVTEADNTINCVAGCAHAYNDSIRVESDLHTANVHACGDNALCHALEATRHEAAVQRIQTGRKSCQDPCHHQGGGKGGR